MLTRLFYSFTFILFLAINSTAQIVIDSSYSAFGELNKLVFYRPNSQNQIDSIKLLYQNKWTLTSRLFYNDQNELIKSKSYDTLTQETQYLNFKEKLEKTNPSKNALATQLIVPKSSIIKMDNLWFSDNSNYYVVRGELLFELNELRTGNKIYELHGEALERFRNSEQWYAKAAYQPSNTGRYVYHFDGIEGNYIFDFISDSISHFKLPEQYMPVNDGLESSLMNEDDSFVYLIGKTIISTFDFRKNTCENIGAYNADNFDYDIQQTRITRDGLLIMVGLNGIAVFDPQQSKSSHQLQLPNEKILKQSGDYIITADKKSLNENSKNNDVFLKNFKSGKSTKIKTKLTIADFERSTFFHTNQGLFLLNYNYVASDLYDGINTLKLFEINEQSGKMNSFNQIEGAFATDRVSNPKIEVNEIKFPVNTELGLRNVQLNFLKKTFEYEEAVPLTSITNVYTSITAPNKIIMTFQKENSQVIGLGLDFKTFDNYFTFDSEEYYKRLEIQNGGKLSKVQEDEFSISKNTILEDSLYFSGNYSLSNMHDYFLAEKYTGPLRERDEFIAMGYPFTIKKHSDNKILALKHDGLVHVDTENKAPYENAVKIFLTQNKDLIYVCDDNYYAKFGSFEKSIRFTQNLKSYPIEQFDLKFNRPDIILDRLGYADSSLIKAYHYAYQKRLKKMGFTEDMLEDDFNLPEIKIENFEEMPTLHDQGSIDIKLKLEDSKYKLDRINVWVNDVSVYGSDGISLRDKDIQEYTTNLKVELAKGQNKVQVSVLNEVGAESYKETFEIECTAGKSDPDLYLITIGESEFEQSDFNLTYAAKDAKDIAALFDKSKAYNEVKTKTLVNKEVTKENVLALKPFLAEADINDEVMIFIAGHGVLDADLDYYFATYDMDFQNPAEKGLAYEDLESLLDAIKPLKKTLLIDACHSGEIDKDEVELAQADIKEDGDIQFRVVGNTATPKLGSQNTSELTKSLFTDLRKGTGATVISSAGGMEFAMEGDDWSNGLFTYCFIKGIQSKAADYDKNGEIWLSEIKRYVSEQVTELSNGKQQPTSRIENQVVDFRVW